MKRITILIAMLVVFSVAATADHAKFATRSGNYMTGAAVGPSKQDRMREIEEIFEARGQPIDKDVINNYIDSMIKQSPNPEYIRYFTDQRNYLLSLIDEYNRLQLELAIQSIQQTTPTHTGTSQQTYPTAPTTGGAAGPTTTTPAGTGTTIYSTASNVLLLAVTTGYQAGYAAGMAAMTTAVPTTLGATPTGGVTPSDVVTYTSAGGTFSTGSYTPTTSYPTSGPTTGGGPGGLSYGGQSGGYSGQGGGITGSVAYGGYIAWD